MLSTFIFENVRMYDVRTRKYEEDYTVNLNHILQFYLFHAIRRTAMELAKLIQNK